MKRLKRFSAYIMTAFVVLLCGQFSMAATAKRDIYSMLFAANKKVSDYKETITSSFDMGGGTVSSVSIYRYSKKDDLTLVEQNMPMSNGKLMTAITSTHNENKRQIYIYNADSKKYEKSTNSQRYEGNNITSKNYIELTDKALKMIVNNATVTEKNGIITINSKLSKSQINAIVKENEDGTNARERSGINRGGMIRRNNDSYSSLKYTFVLMKGKLTNITVEQKGENISNSGNNGFKIHNKTSYSITYESQKGQVANFMSKRSSKNYTGDYYGRGYSRNMNRSWNNGRGGQGWHGSFYGGFGRQGQVAESSALIDAKIVLATGAFLILLALIYSYMIKKTTHKIGMLQNKWAYVIAMALILGVRIIIAIKSTGFESDIRLFQQWATSAASNGLSEFYGNTRSVDYPPGYIFVLYVIGKLYSLFKLEMNSDMAILLIKLPAILADMAISAIVFMVARKKISEIGAFGLSVLFALNPSAIVDSTIWGQVDSVSVLFILVAIILLSKKKMRISSVVFAAAILIKPQALIFSPIFIWAFIRERNLKEFLLSALSGAATLIILLLPFSIKQNPTWIIDLYKNTLGSYPFASVNAFNMFAFFGGNYVQDTSTFLIFSYKTWSTILILCIVVFSGYMFFRHREAEEEEGFKFFYIAAFIIMAVFTLTSKMHERYMYPVMIFSLMSYIYSKNIKILYIYAATTCTFFVNVFYILKSGAMVQITNSDLWLVFTAICNIVILGCIMSLDLVKKTTKN